MLILLPFSELTDNRYAVRWSGEITAPESGEYSFRAAGAFGQLTLDGKSLGGRFGMEPEFVTLEAGKTYKIMLQVADRFGGMNFGLQWSIRNPGYAGNARAQAVEAARNADAAVLFLGLSPRLEGEEMRVQVEGFSGGDRVTIDLSRFSERFKDEKSLVGRVTEDRTVVPYYERKDIDEERVLDGKAEKIAWVKDKVALFFLEIQGSGKIILDDGRTMRIHYHCSNGRAYRSIGRLLIEQGNCPCLYRILIGGFLIIHLQVMTDFLIDDVLYFLYLLGSHGSQMRKIEPEPVRGNQRAPLLYVFAEHLAQRRLEEMGGSMVAGDIPATFHVHRCLYLFSIRQESFDYLTLV